MFMWGVSLMLLPLVALGGPVPPNGPEQSFSTLPFPPLPQGFRNMAQKLMSKCPRMGVPFPTAMDNMMSSKGPMGLEHNPFCQFLPVLSSLPPPQPQPAGAQVNATHSQPFPVANWNMTEKLMNCSNLLSALELMRNFSEVHQCFFRAFVAPLSWDALVVNGTNLKPKERDLLLWGSKVYLQDAPPSLSTMPSQLDRTQLTDMMSVFSETFGSTPMEQRVKIKNWAMQQVSRIYFNCSSQTPLGPRSPENKPQAPDPCLPGPWLTADVMNTMGRFLQLLSPSDFNRMSKDELCRFVQSPQFPASFRGMGDDSSSVGKMLLDRVRQDCFTDQQKYLQNPERLGPLACFLEDTLSINTSLSETLLSQLGECENSAATKLKKNLLVKVMSVVGKPLNPELLKSMGSAVSSLPASRLADLSNTTVQNNLASLRQAKWNLAQATVLASIMLKGDQSVSVNDLIPMGSVVRGVGSSLLKKLDYHGMLGSEELANMSRELSHLQRTAMLEAVLRNPNASDLIGSLPDPLFPILSLETLDKARLLSVEQLKDHSWTRAQAAFLVSKILSGKIVSKQLGSVGSAVQGVTCEMIASTNQSNATEVAQMLAVNAVWLSRTQVICAVKKVFFGADGNLRNITSADLSSIPTLLLVHLPSKTIGELPKSLCSTFLDKIAQANLSSLPAKSLSRSAFVDKAFACLGKDSSALSSNDILRLGNLVCEFDGSRLSSLPSEAINATLLALVKCPNLRLNNAAIILKQLKATYGDPSTWSSSTMMSVGSLLLLNESVVMSLPFQPWLKEALQSILDNLPPIPSPASPELYPSLQHLSTLHKKIFSLATEPTSTRRKREIPGPTSSSITVPTLQNIEDLKEKNVYWSADQLAAIPSQIFADAVSTLGMVTNYSAQQLQALKHKAHEVWGVLGALSEKHVQQMGCVAQAFNHTELQGLNITSLDTLDMLSSCSWNSSQRAAVCVAFFKNTGLTPAKLGATDIVGLGQFLCGLSPNETSQLKPDCLREALTSVCKLQCPMNVMVQLKEVVVKAFGVPANWTAAHVSYVGTILAALTSSELKSLKPSSLPFISPSAIPFIPPDVLASLSASQLQALGADNAAMVTDAQKELMTEEQRSSLASTADVSYTRAEVTTLKPGTALPQKAGAPGHSMVKSLVFLQPLLLVGLRHVL